MVKIGRSLLARLTGTLGLLGLFLFGVLAPSASAGAATGPFASGDLDGIQAIVTAFLAVGAAVAIAMAIFRRGRAAANKV